MQDRGRSAPRPPQLYFVPTFYIPTCIFNRLFFTDPVFKYAKIRVLYLSFDIFANLHKSKYLFFSMTKFQKNKKRPKCDYILKIKFLVGKSDENLIPTFLYQHLFTDFFIPVFFTHGMLSLPRENVKRQNVGRIGREAFYNYIYKYYVTNLH